jgi:uncharacterized protein YwgA
MYLHGFCNIIGVQMDFESRNFERKKRISSPKSINTVIEISKKVNELIEKLGYNNEDLLLTKAHIKNNIMQLINSNNSNNLEKVSYAKKKCSSKISCNYHVDIRGRLITSYSK